MRLFRGSTLAGRWSSRSRTRRDRVACESMVELRSTAPWALRVGVQVAFLASVSAGASACVDWPARAKLEDGSRKAAPVPACVMQLPPRRVEAAGASRRLTEGQIWKAVFPAFDEATNKLPAAASTCTERHVFADAPFKGATPMRPFPFVAEEGDVLYGNGGDRLKVVWFRTHRGGDGTMVGPLAVVRPLERFAEVYGVGSLRGNPERVELGTERLGGDFVVTAKEDTCADRKGNAGCESLLRVLLPRHGNLVPVVEIPVERIVLSAKGAERGASGVLEYHLTTAPRFEKDGIHLTEQIRVKDDGGRELRKAEGERVYHLEAGTMSTTDEALWDRVYGPSKR
jgi:hypothetical protein